MCAFAMLDGTFVGFGSCLSSIFTPLGFTSSEISGLGAVTIIFGVMGSFVTGYLLQKYHRYKLMLICSGGLTSFFLLLAIFTFPSDNLWLITSNVWTAGIFMVPCIPICMNFADELCFPLEATAV
jgi:MFS family permease